MPLPDPCCGRYSLQEGTKFVAIAEFVLYALVLLGLALDILSILLQDGLRNLPLGWMIIIFIASLGQAILGISGIVFGLILLKASKERDQRRCKLWLFFQIAVVIVMFLMIFRFSLIVYVLFPLIFFTRIYFAWVVFSFWEELKGGGNNETMPDGAVPDAEAGGQSNTGTAVTEGEHSQAA